MHKYLYRTANFVTRSAIVDCSQTQSLSNEMLDPSLLQCSSLARYSEPKRWNFFVPVLTLFRPGGGGAFEARHNFEAM